MGAVIRDAVAADAVEVAAVHDRSRRAYYESGGIAVPDYGGDRAAWWATRLTDTERTNRVAVAAGRVVGLMSCGPRAAGDGYELFSLYVLPEFWGNGVGGALHAEFVAARQASGIAPGVLEVWDKNSRAIRFYERNGWQPTDASRVVRAELGEFTFRRMEHTLRRRVWR